MKIIYRETLKDMLDKNEHVLLVNVLSEESFEDEHIPGSQHVCFDNDDEDFIRQINMLSRSRDEPIVLYCHGMEWPPSVIAANALEQGGYKNVLVYEGGLKDWKEATYPLQGEKAGKKPIHQPQR